MISWRRTVAQRTGGDTTRTNVVGNHDGPSTELLPDPWRQRSWRSGLGVDDGAKPQTPTH